MSTSMIETFLRNTGLKPMLEKEGVTEIIINRPFEIITEGDTGWEYHDAPGASYTDLLDLVIAINNFNNSAEPLDSRTPIKSLVMPGGERLQVIMPPACEAGCLSITIRKPSLRRFTLDNYIESGRFDNVTFAEKSTATLTETQRHLLGLFDEIKGNKKAFKPFFQACVDARLNFLVVGGTGSGKTTVGKAIADLFPHDRRIITIEDVHEMPLPYHKNHVHLFYKRGGVEARYLIEAAMRMKPDHIFLAELRGDEAWSYLEALNTGHEGSITTIHANNTYASFSRLASIIKQSSVGLTLDYDFVLKTVKTSLDVILFFNRTHLTEIYFNPAEKNRLLAGE